VSDVRAELREWLVTKRTESQRQAERLGPGGAEMYGEMYAGLAESFGLVIDHLDGQQGPLDHTELRGWLEAQQNGIDQKRWASPRPPDYRGLSGMSGGFGETLRHLGGIEMREAERAERQRWAQLVAGVQLGTPIRAGLSAGTAPAPVRAATEVGRALRGAARATRRAVRSRAGRSRASRPDAEQSAG
jgi:hypothetical protein